MLNFFGFLAALAWVGLLAWIFYRLEDRIKDVLFEVKDLIHRIRSAEWKAPGLSGSIITAQEASRLEDRDKLRETTLSRMEAKILCTLFTKQVNQFPNFENVWTFWIGPTSAEYADYIEAKGKLLAKGFIVDKGDPEHSIFLSTPGFYYCRDNYSALGADQWWKEDAINPVNLTKVMSGEFGPDAHRSGSGSGQAPL